MSTMNKGIQRFMIAGLIGFLLCVSCEESAVKTEADIAPQQELSSTFGEGAVPFPNLTAGAENILSNWPVFDDLRNELGEINGKTISEIKVKTERLKLFSDSLIKTIPDTLSTNAIRSRLLIVNTRVNMLDQEVRKSRPDSAAIQECMFELNDAGMNFMNQIEAKLQKDQINQERKEDEEKELEKQQRFLDSVYQAELQDQQK